MGRPQLSEALELVWSLGSEGSGFEYEGDDNPTAIWSAGLI